MMGEEDQHNPPEVFVLKKEVLSEDDTDVGDVSACVENNDKCNKTVGAGELSGTKHEPCWSDWEPEDIGITEMEVFPDEGEVQSDLPIVEGAPKYSYILKQEQLDPEFVCMDSDGTAAWDETSKMCVDPLADADVMFHHYANHEFQECPNAQQNPDTYSSLPSSGRVNNPFADDFDQKKPCNSSTVDLNISREQSPSTVAEHLSGPHKPELVIVGRLFVKHEQADWSRCNAGRLKVESGLVVSKHDCGREVHHNFEKSVKTSAHLKHNIIRHEPLKCISCDKIYPSRKTLMTHMLYKCDRHKPLSCESCGKNYITRKSLMTHMRYRCVPQEIFECDGCGKIFKARSNLVAHITYNCGQERQHKCESCGKVFKQIFSLRSHVTHDCGRREPHKCDSCGKTFKIKTSLVAHTKHHCGHQEPQKCESCGKSFKHKFTLRAHKKYDCGRKEPHKCEYCGKTYKIRKSLLAHLIDCGHHEPRTCESCGKTFKQKISLMSHIKEDCGRQEPHKCDSCGKTFKMKKYLTSHVNRECGRRQERHKCELCGKTYKYINSLVRHKKHDCGH